MAEAPWISMELNAQEIEELIVCVNVRITYLGNESRSPDETIHQNNLRVIKLLDIKTRLEEHLDRIGK